MKFKKTFLTLGLALSAFACSDINTEAYDFISSDQYPENEVQAIRVANPALARVQGLADWGGWWFLQEITTDEAAAPTRGGDWDDGGKWRVLHQHSWGNGTEAVEQLWRLIFEEKGLPAANLAIDQLTPGAEGSPEVATVLAQVKVLRAYWFYLGIDNFGDIPFPRSYINNPDRTPSRTPKAEVFATIVQDIQESIEFLPDPVPGSKASSINKATAYALLAKLYLNAQVYTGTAMWSEANQACDNVLQYGYVLESDPSLPFKANNTASKELIWTVPYDKDNFTGFNLHMRTLNYLNQLTFGMDVQPWNGFAMVEDHFNTFAANDLRQYALLKGQQYTLDGNPILDADANGAPLVLTPHIPALFMDAASYTKEQIRMSGVRVVKWEIPQGIKENLSTDYPIFRLADIILMKAEVMVRLNGAGSGDSYVNQIKARAGIPQLGGYTLDDILAERGREMTWEGHRRQDLIRFGKFQNTWWEKTNTDPNRKLFPIPQFAINANPNLTQNPGY
ncbi:RagB/SusD family nutrient uptake outer membrane protein [Flavobacterium silvaticum]|uniref:RagB/SusD family nutrient uptake outer membrane protein n=1 Tax=Flavobacterium silvaticum TaxID=1852020 RepID=A0A972FKZ4_9FLAO|nr:RagB/SusD family nutrient uptake outer membrane protein [Flavobacterium silvaticum]NMH27160.1 RagB/SusD family nutrient uptake outer membrane protein [Flavobacterium silvaticum]